MPVIVQIPPRTDDWREVGGWRQNVYDVLSQLSLNDDGNGLIVENFAITDTLYVDRIREYTVGVGVTVEDVLLQDGNITIGSGNWLGGGGGAPRLAYDATEQVLAFLDDDVETRWISLDDANRYTSLRRVAESQEAVRTNQILGLQTTSGLEFAGASPCEHVNSGVYATQFQVDGKTTFTIEFWAKPVAADVNGTVFGTIWGANYFYFGQDAGGSGSWSAAVGASGWGDTGVACDAGVWQHIVYRSNALAATCDIWKNGVLAGTEAYDENFANLPRPLAGPDGTQAWIGDYNNGSAGGHNWYAGVLDEVRVYNRELTDAEIVAHYAAGVGLYGSKETGQLGGYHMDEGSGAVTLNYQNGEARWLYGDGGEPDWTPLTPYGSGSIAKPGIGFVGLLLRAIWGGTSAAAGPPTPSYEGQIILDGTVIWEAVYPDMTAAWAVGHVPAVQAVFDVNVWSAISSSTVGTIGDITFGAGLADVTLVGQQLMFNIGTNTLMRMDTGGIYFYRDIIFYGDNLRIADVDSSHSLGLLCASDLTADRNLAIFTGDADRSLTFEGDAIVSQDYSTDGDVQFGTITTTGVGTFDSVIVSNGGSLDVYEDITWLGGTGENLLQFPTNLAVALEIGTTGVPYQVFDSTTDAEQIEYFSNQYVITKAGTDEAVNAAIDSGALNILLTAGGTVDAESTIDNDYTMLRGGGWGTLLDATGAHTFHVINLGSHDYCSVRDMRIQGKSSGTASDLINGNGAEYTTLMNLWLEDSDDDAAYLYNCDYSTVAFCNIIDADGDGIDFSHSDFVRCFGNYFKDNGGYGVLSDSTNRYSTYMGNILWNDFARLMGGYNTYIGNVTLSASCGVNTVSSYQPVIGNVWASCTNSMYMQSSLGVIFGNCSVTPTQTHFSFTANRTRNIFACNNLYQAANTYNDMPLDQHDDSIYLGNLFISAVGKSERAIYATNTERGVIVASLSLGHDTGGLNLDTDSHYWTVVGNNFYGDDGCSDAPIVVAGDHNILMGNHRGTTAITNTGANNIIFDHDTTNMVSLMNHACSWIAADGARAGEYVGIFHNLEATDDESFGVYIRAGSTTADYNIRGYDHDAANELWHIDGAGNLFVANSLECLQATATKINLGGGLTAFVLNGVSLDAVVGATSQIDTELHYVALQHSNTALAGTRFMYGRSRGTLAVPVIVQDNDVLAAIDAAGFDGTDYVLAAQIDFEVDGAPGANDMPGRIVFKTTTDGGVLPTTRWTIDSTGQLLSGADGTAAFDIVTAGSVACGAIALTGDLILSEDILNADNDDVLTIYGGNGAAQGASISLYGETHATGAGDMYFYSGAFAQLWYDRTNDEWYYYAGITLTTGETLSFADGGSVNLISTTVGDPGDDTTLVTEQGIREALDAIPAGGDVTAGANIADHTLVRGDGGAKGIQDSGITVSDADDVSGMGTLGCGAITSTGDITAQGGDVHVGVDKTTEGILHLYGANEDADNPQGGATYFYSSDFYEGNVDHWIIQNYAGDLQFMSDGAHVMTMVDATLSVNFHTRAIYGIGTVGCGAITSTGNLIVLSDIGIAADTDLIQLTAANTVQVNGNVGIGVAPSYPLHLTGAMAGDFITKLINSTATNPNGLWIDFSGASNDDNTRKFLVCEDSTAYRCYIYSDGDLANHDGTYGAISDVSLKQDIVDAPSYWDDFKNVRYRKFRFASDVEADKDAPDLFGTVAQELATVFPRLVHESDGIKWTDISTLSQIGGKVLQEAQVRIELADTERAAMQARIDSLEAEVATLKTARN